MAAFLFAGAHLVLYLLWWLPAQRERVTRGDGATIPFYYSGSIGDLIGFTFTSYVFGSVASVVAFSSYVLSGCLAVCSTYVLHTHWKRVSKLSSVSLYTQDGVTTVAGTIHLAYVVVVTVTLFCVLLNWSLLSTNSQVYFLVGLSVYGIAVSIDRAWGVL